MATNEKQKKIKEFLSILKPDELHILFFNYSAKKFWYNPFLLATKLYYHLHNKKKIDHVAHVSRVGDKYFYNFDDIKIFEANVKKGMIESNLEERLMHFEGNVYLFTFKDYKIDKNICREFEKDFRNKKYDIIKAVGSAVDDYKWFTKLVKRKKKTNPFCSYLATTLMNRLGFIDVKKFTNDLGGAENVSPPELYNFLNLKDIVNVEYHGEIIKVKIEKQEFKTKILNKTNYFNFLKNSKFLASIIIILALIYGFFKINSLLMEQMLKINAFYYQQKEHLILSAMDKSLEDRHGNIYLSLVVLDQDKRKYTFVDIINVNQNKMRIPFYFHTTQSIVRSNLRHNFKTICNPEDLKINSEIPPHCLEQALPIDKNGLRMVHGLFIDPYVVIASCYFSNCEGREIVEILNKIKEGL